MTHLPLSSRIASMLKSAEKQILSRPSDPLSVSVSYEIMRNGIGALGVAFPIILILGGGLDHLQPSLSAYYHFSQAHPAQHGAGTMRDAFVGMLCAIGAFLFFYRGHSLQEDLALNIAGIAAVIVAIFPMDWPAHPATGITATSRLHSMAATAFFIMIGYVCVFRARDTLCIVDDTKRRKSFRRIYLALGVLMLATPAAITLLEATRSTAQSGYTTLAVEAAGVFVFAAYWLVKGYEIRSSLHPSLPIKVA